MSYRHEILYLNASRAYVRVGDAWYDTRVDFDHVIGESFLTGYIEEILSFTQYKKQYPESKNPMADKVLDKTNGGGCVRRASSKISPDGYHYSLVEYAVNPQQIVIDTYQPELTS